MIIIIATREAKRGKFSRSRPSCVASRLLCHTSLPGKGHHRRHRWYHRHNHHHWGQAGLWPPRPWWINFAPCFAPLVLSLVGSVTFPDMHTQTHKHTHMHTQTHKTHALWHYMINWVYAYYAGCSKCDDQLAAQWTAHWGRQVLCGATSGRVVVMMIIMKAMSLDGLRKEREGEYIWVCWSKSKSGKIVKIENPSAHGPNILIDLVNGRWHTEDKRLWKPNMLGRQL